MREEKPLISTEDHPSTNNNGGHFHLSLKCVMGRLGSSPLAECGLAVKLFTFIRVEDYWFFVFFSFRMLNIVLQFSQH